MTKKKPEPKSSIDIKDLQDLLGEIEDDDRKEKRAARRNAQAQEFKRVLNALVDRRVGDFFNGKPELYADLQVAATLRAKQAEQGKDIEILKAQCQVDHEDLLHHKASMTREHTEFFNFKRRGFLQRLGWVLFGNMESKPVASQEDGDDE